MFEKNIKQLETSLLALDSIIEEATNIERVSALDPSIINPCKIETEYYCPVKPTLSKTSSSALETKSLQLYVVQSLTIYLSEGISRPFDTILQIRNKIPQVD